MLYSHNIFAADLVINEFTSAESSDWIELYNNTDNDIDLLNYKILDSENHEKNLSSIINGKSFYSASISILNQGADEVKLIKISDNSIIDSMKYGTGGIVEAPASGQSIGRDSDGGGSFAIQQTPTRGCSNTNPSYCPTPRPTISPTQQATNSPPPTVSPTPTPSPSPTFKPTNDYNNLYLTEIYPSPETGGNEWIEIYNDNDSEVNLNGWFIEDNAGTFKELKDFTISGKSYAYFAFGSGYLNNIGDTISLLNADKVQKSGLPAAYPNLTSTQSWAKIDSDWCIASPTKGEPNRSCANETITTTTKPSASPTSRPTSKPTNKIDLVKTLSQSATNSSENERKLPVLGAKSSIDETISQDQASTRRSIPKILLPLGIAGSGLMLLGGSLALLNKPELIEGIMKLIARK